MVAGKRHGLEIVSRVQVLYKEGLSKREISRSLGICYSSVRRFVDPKYNSIHNTVRIRVGGHSHRTGAFKRLRPSNCELCGKLARLHEKSLYWHHWDDDHLEWGLWLCNRCHIGSEFVEGGLDAKYKELKGDIEC